MHYTTLFFDLDDTLYPPSAGLWSAIRERMTVYMHERLGLSWEKIPEKRKFYLETYGTTLRGLQHEYHVDADDYLAFVHNLPLADYLRPQPEIKPMLLSLPQRKWIFTNADSHHARRVLQVLNLSECFVGIIDVRLMDFLNKPDVRVYHKALELAKVRAQDSVLFDDAPRNLQTAREIGFTTVLVHSTESNASIDYTISSLADLPETMPELWLDGHKTGS